MLVDCTVIEAAAEVTVFFLKKPSYPFDWKTPVGYLVAWFSQFTAFCAAFSISIPNISFFFGSCWLFIFVADDITKDLSTFNAGKVKNGNRVVKLKRFCDIIQVYTDAKQ